MSDPVPEKSVLAADFRSEILSAYQQGGVSAPRKVEFLGSFSDGTRYLVEDGVRQLHWYLVTDLSSFSISRAGVTSVTIALNQAQGTALQTISPALPDSVLANWLLIGTSSQTWIIKLALVSTTSLSVTALREFTATSAVGPGNIDVNDQYPTDTQVDVGLGHTHLLGTLLNPTHSHSSLVVSAGAVTGNVYWIIVHK